MHFSEITPAAMQATGSGFFILFYFFFITAHVI